MTSLVDMTDAERRLAEKIDHRLATDLAVSQRDGGLQFQNASQLMEMAKMMAVSAVAIPKHLRANPGACLAVVLQSVEWRMSPYAVANKSYSVNDRLAYESQLVQAVILQRAPIKGRFKFTYDGEGQRRRCTVTARLLDGDEVFLTTPALGDIPVKNSPLWKGDPDQQLAYYGGRALCRRYFPDVLLGVYTDDEVAAASPMAIGGAHVIEQKIEPRTISSRLDALGGDDDHSSKESFGADNRRSDGADEGGDATSSKQSASPSSDEIDNAERAGMDDARDGIPRRGIPNAYKDQDVLKAAWLRGWDSASAEAEGGAA